VVIVYSKEYESKEVSIVIAPVAVDGMRDLVPDAFRNDVYRLSQEPHTSKRSRLVLRSSVFGFDDARAAA